MRPSIPRPGSLAIALLVSLSSIMGLGLEAEPPEVDPASIRLLDEGQEVVARGQLVDLRRYDSGFETLVIASQDGQSTLRAQVQQGLRPQPSTYARMGDVLRILGRVSDTGSGVVLRCDGDSISVEARAETVLTVRSLSQTWHLFLGDELRIGGYIMASSSSEGLRLYDRDFLCSILLTEVADFEPSAVSSEAVVVGHLGLDSSSMRMFLRVADIMPST